MNTQLDLFSTHNYQSEVFGAEYITVRPYNTIDNGPIDFIVRESKEYYDLSETMLSLKVRVVNADGSVIATAADGKDNVALVNNAMHSIFSNVQVLINGKPVEGVPDGMYPYRSYIANLFRFSREAQAQQLFSEGFVRDDHSHMDAVTNSGFVARKAWTAAGATKQFYGRLCCGMLQQKRFLVPGVDFQLRLERAKDAFALMTANNLLKPKVLIVEAHLHMLAVKVNPAILQHQTVTLARGVPALYEFNKVEIDTIPIRQKTTNEVKEDLFHGRVPKYLFMLMVSNSAFHGDYALNPFNMKHYNVKSLLLTRDAENVPYERFEPDFKTGNCLREYMSLYQSNGLLGKNAILPISYEEFKCGYTQFQWNLSDDRRGVNAGPYQRANLKLDITFADETPEALMVVLYGIFESIVQVFGNDEVIVDGV